MKRTGIDHPKTKRLAKLLAVPHYSAVGVLECVWHFTARHALCGDIGRWSDEEIAESAGWPSEDAGRLITALVESGWLDRHEQHRFVVHDWHDHCDESVKKTAKKHGRQFASLKPTKAVPESFATVPEQFANSGEQVATVPDSRSHSRSQSQATASASSQTPTECTWEGVEAEFCALPNFGTVNVAMKAAREGGYSPHQTAALISHYRANPNRWDSPGVILWRLQNSPPTRPIEEGWPHANGTHTNTADDAHLESVFGKQINAMKESELLSAMKRAGIAADKLPHVRQVGTKIRGQLLRHLAGEAQTSTPALNAKPPPAASPVRKHERTPHGNEASALRSAQSP